VTLEKHVQRLMICTKMVYQPLRFQIA